MLSASDIKKIQDYFSTKPVKKAFVFGSYARNEEQLESDIDILIEIEDNVRMGLVKYITMQFDLEELVKRKVDLLSEGGISKFIAPHINHDKVLIYEKGNGQ